MSGFTSLFRNAIVLTRVQYSDRMNRCIPTFHESRGGGSRDARTRLHDRASATRGVDRRFCTQHRWLHEPGTRGIWTLDSGMRWSVVDG